MSVVHGQQSNKCALVNLQSLALALKGAGALANTDELEDFVAVRLFTLHLEIRG